MNFWWLKSHQPYLIIKLFFNHEDGTSEVIENEDSGCYVEQEIENDEFVQGFEENDQSESGE